MKIWFGGYTKDNSRGIYATDFKDLPIADPTLNVEIDNPTYFQITKDQQLISIIKDGDMGGIALFDLSQNPVKKLSQAIAAGTPPAYVGLNEKQNLVYVANYHEGLLQVYSYQDDVLSLIAATKHEGFGPKPEQQSAHPHFFDQTPTGDLVSVDLGLDQVEFYQLKNNELKSLAIYQNHPGFGSRHLVFHPTAPVMFIVGELSSEVNVVKIGTDYSFSDLQTISTISKTFSKHNGAAAINITADGKYLYISNRGENTIVVFKIDPKTFKLQLIQRIKTGGDFPRDFNLTPAEDYLIVANQISGSATIYIRNLETGFLTLAQKDIVTPEATRVLLTEN